MLKIYTNAVTKKNYDEYGNLFASGMPWMFYKGTEKVCWQICSETPEGADAINPDEVWTKYTGYTNFDAVGALLTADSDYQLRMPGTLSTAVNSGTVSSVVAKINGATYALIPETGVVTLFTSSGESESLEYESRSLSGDVVTFAIASGSSVENSYAEGAEMDVTQSVYMQASLDTVESDVSNGLFVFNITAFSEKLRRSIVYSNVRALEISGLELAIFSMDSQTNAVEDIDRYVVESFTIRSGIAEIGALQNLPEGREDEVVTLVNTMLAGGFSLQFSSDNSSWHDAQAGTDKYFRFRSTASGGTWSAGIKLPDGAKGDPGEDGQDGETPDIAIGTVSTLEPGTPATAEITGTTPNLTLNLGIPKGADGQDGQSTYTYVAYASDASGSNFSLSPSNSLKYRAEIHVGTAIPSPAASDFSGATWVKYIGDDGGGSGSGDMTKTVYDTNNDGIVNAADTATTATTASTSAFASTAGKFADPVSIGSASFDGSASLTLQQIGAAASTHSHSIGDVTGLQTALDGKASSSHSHAISDVTGLRAELDSTVKVVSALPTASADTVGKCYLNLADSHIYLGTGSASATGNIVAHFSPDHTVDGINNDTFTYDSGTGDSRKWTCEPGATTYVIQYSNGAWKLTGIAWEVEGYYFATAASGSNPWDAGLVWKFHNDSTSQDVDLTAGYVEANVTYSFTQII